MLYDPSKAKPVDAAGWVLWNAADYIEKHGWCQNTIETAGGQVCAMGGIIAVGRSNLVDAQVAINRMTAHIGRRIPFWNDEPGRTKGQVVAALRAAALAA